MKSEASNYVREYLLSVADEKHRLFQSKLVPNVSKENIIGIKTPVIKAFAVKAAKMEDISGFLCDLPHKYLEEYTLHGAIISLDKDFDNTVKNIDKLLPFIDNWATCDSLKPKSFKKNTDKLTVHIKRWILSNETYTVRFGVECLMNYYLDDKFGPEYLKLVSGIKSEEYYVNMMSAWFFATALAKQWDSTIPYIENKKLDKWVHNKTVRKAIESYRITDGQKQYLRSLIIK